MNTPNIHSNKYASAPLPELCAPRNELIARLDKAARGHLVFICAPAGSGKTVSALLWTGSSRRKSVWIGLDAFDNATAVFYRMFCMGLLSAQPSNERMGAVLNSASFNSSPVEHTILFLAEFLTDGEAYALVLDDFHTITNNEILKSLPYILRRMPRSFVTFILSRSEPNGHFSDFLAQTQVVSADALAFSKNEIVEYFSLLGRGVSADDAGMVSTYTGGWAIGVNALAQSTADIATLGEYNTKSMGGVQVLSHYIEKHLWSEWDTDLRAFMLALAVLDEMPVPLCVKITGEKNAGEILEQLRMRNAFISRIEDGVYRYHHLFLDFLRARPEYTKTNKKKYLNAAAEYYLSIGDDTAAQRYAYESGKASNIIKLYNTYMYDNTHHIEEYLSIARNFYFTPSAQEIGAKYPALNMARAFTALLVGNNKLFENILDALRPSIPLIILKYPRFGELAVGIDGVDYRIPLDKLMTKAEWIPKIIFQESTFRQGFLTFEMPFLHRSSRDYAELSDPAIFAKVEKTFGKLFKNHFEIIVLHCVAGGLLLEQNQINQSLAKAQGGAVLSAPWMAREIRFAANMHLAAVYLALNKTEELAAILRTTEEFIQTRAQFLRPNFLAFTTRIKLWDGDTEAAKEWLAHYFVNEGSTPELYRVYQYFTTVRAYAVSGELDKAKDFALRLRQLGKDFNRPQDAAEAGALLAVILWAESKKDEAQQMLETVLAELQPYNFIRLIADEGAAITPLLKKISTKCERADYKGPLTPSYVKKVYLTAYAVGKQRRGIIRETKPVRLSNKQKLVIELFAQGHNREGVMNKTGMALGTFKTHIRLAYEKLGVNNANDAVMKARALGVIE